MKQGLVLIGGNPIALVFWVFGLQVYISHVLDTLGSNKSLGKEGLT